MKKIIILFLTAGMILSGLPQLYVIADGADSPRGFAFAQAMGILPENMGETDTMTRQQLAESYAYIITGSRETGVGKPTRFTDVFGSDAIWLADAMGIMTGQSETLFAPSEPVTYVQLVTTMVKFLGYDPLANQLGGYPYGYLNIGAQLKFSIAGVQAQEPVTAAQVGRLFQRAAEVSMMRGLVIDGDTFYEVADGETYLELYLHVTKQSGVVTANAATSLRGARHLEPNQIALDDTIYDVDNRVIAIRENIGYRVDAYIKEISPQERYILYYEEDNAVIEIAGNAIKDVSHNRICYYQDNGRTSYLTFGNATHVIYNGTLCPSYDESVLHPFDGTTKDGCLRGIDNDRDGVYDVLYVSAYDSYVVGDVADGVIFNRFAHGEVLDMRDFREGEVTIVNVLGEPLQFAEIGKNDVLCIERDIAGQIKRITVVIDRVVGSITELDLKSGELYLGGTRYQMANAMRNSDGYETLRVGKRGQFYFTCDGQICAADFDGYDGNTLGYLTQLKRVNKLGDGEYIARIFTKTGAFATYAFAKKVTMDERKVDAEDAAALFGGTGDATERQAIWYRLNEKDEIAELAVCDTTNDGTRDGLYQYPGFDGVSARPSYKSGMGSFGAKLLINTGTIIMEVPTEENRGKEVLYSIKTPSYFPNDSGSPLFSAYGTKKNAAVAELVVCVKDAVQQISSYENICVVEEIADGLNADGEPVKLLRGLINGKPGSLPAKEGALAIRPLQYPAPADSAQQTYGYPQKGDAILLSTDKEGEINYAKYVFDYERQSIYYSGSMPVANNRTANPSGTFTAERRFLYGKVIRCDDGNLTLEIQGYDGTLSYEHYPASKFLLMQYDAQAGRYGTFAAANYTDIRSSEMYPGHESYVLVQQRYGDAKCMVIYHGGDTK